ncbi:MAG: HD-GYP domain-containing protein, partial [Acidimicrobiia bacterium]
MGTTAPDTQQTSSGTPWESRRVLAAAVRVAIAVVPLISSILVILVVGRIWVQPSGPAKAGWWVVLCGLSTGVYYLIERVTRRFLPLASLLKLTLIFPDEAPSRFSMALRSGNTKHLEKTVEAFKSGEIPTDIGERAMQVLELATAVNEHDRGTRGHSERVRAYTEMIAIEMGLSDDRIERLRWAALLHDVGKLYVPASILNKAGRPSDAEWNVIKGHPILGEHLVEPLSKFLGDALTATGQHHEKWDGTGYPRGLKGTEIGWAARIVAVADSYAVMTAARSYKKPMSDAAARAELAKCAGTQFDPTVVRAMLNLSMGRRRPLAGMFAPLVNLVSFGAASASSPAVTMAAGASLSMGMVAAATTSDISAFAIPTKDDQASHAAEVFDAQVAPDLAEPTTTVITVSTAASPATAAQSAGSPEARREEGPTSTTTSTSTT